MSSSSNHTSSSTVFVDIHRGVKRKCRDDQNSQNSSQNDGSARKRYKTRTVQRDRRERAKLRASQLPQQDSNKPPFIPDTQFYFDDGDIYAVVDSILFCVHVDKLVAAGGLFEDLLGGVVKIQPSENEKIYDLPCLKVPLVSAREFRFFLGFLYEKIVLIKWVEAEQEEIIEDPEEDAEGEAEDASDLSATANNTNLATVNLAAVAADNASAHDVESEKPKKTPAPPAAPKPLLYWEAAASLLKVSNELNLGHVRKAALEALEHLFPTSGEPAFFKPVIGGLQTKADQELFHRTFPIQAIEMFEAYDVPVMLPMAYYHAAQLSLEDIIDGVQSGDERLQLKPATIITVLRGREALKASRRGVIFMWLDATLTHFGPKAASNGCYHWIMKSGDHCWGFLNRLHKHCRDTGHIDLYANGLESLSEKACKLFTHHLCKPCCQNVLEMADLGLKHNWTQIPFYFGLKSWDVLRKKQTSIDQAWDGDFS
ncbi:hypothetical protein GALMADRAFT_226976 [Galerina marginata CBS 339.88]|uniref:BTB domain-containing protein n=1 Tax=Galerina marginata (strain CBS 339.88) TaxID=685588 RepID=A0A067T5V9_GALM3|nr:hypothetical protein GALMADRAFT_226976 [Galerina marginata CBS 339.88]